MKKLNFNLCFVLFFVFSYPLESRTVEEVSVLSFDFIDNQLDKGFASWNYSDIGSNDCGVYNGLEQSKLCGPNNMKFYTYFNPYNSAHMGWTRFSYIDSEAELSVKGNALKVVQTGGSYEESGELKFSGLPIKSKSQFEAYVDDRSRYADRALPGDSTFYFRSKDSVTPITDLKGKNRLSVWVFVPKNTSNIDEQSSEELTRPNYTFSFYPFIGDSRGGHYYHSSSNIAMGGWTKLQFDAHPTHHNGGVSNPYKGFSEGGEEYPENGKSYFSNIVAFALRTPITENQESPFTFYMDEISSYYKPYENEETINNVGVGYDPVNKRFDVSLEDKYRCLKCYAEYEIKYSFEPIDNTNFESAYTPEKVINFDRNKNNIEGIIYKPNPGYNQVWAALDIQEKHKELLTDNTIVYFAIKDRSTREFITQHQADLNLVRVPELGDVRKVDLIKTIDYQIIPVKTKLSFDGVAPLEAIQGQELEKEITVSGGITPYEYEVEGVLPRGIQLTDKGVLRGVADEEGHFAFDVKVTDKMGDNEVQPMSLSVDAPVSFFQEQCGVVIDFGDSELSSEIIDKRFSTIIKDKYTGFVDKGTSIFTKSHRHYDFQGVVADSELTFNKGDKIRTIWFNDSEELITFMPRLSFSDKDRPSDSLDLWEHSSSVTIAPKSYAISVFELIRNVRSDVINVNVNYDHVKSLILDRIEWVEHVKDPTDKCGVLNTVNEHVIADFYKSDSLTEEGMNLPGWNKVLRDKYTNYVGAGLSSFNTDVGQYNFHGVTGKGRFLKQGDIIKLTWRNETETEAYSFTPRISLSETGRVQDGSNWTELDAIELNPGETKESFFFLQNKDMELVKTINVNNPLNEKSKVSLDRISLITSHPINEIVSSVLPIGVEGKSYSQRILAYSNDKYSFRAVDEIPRGVSLSSSGNIEGTPAKAGSHSFNVQMLVGGNVVSEKTILFTVLPDNHLDAERCELLADFYKSKSESYLDYRFHETAMDIYTGFVEKGLVIKTGNISAYNFQAIIGELVTHNSGNVVRAVWYNAADEDIVFQPLISFEHVGRYTRESKTKWSAMTETYIPAKSYAVSEFTLSNTTVNSININVNYNNNKMLILDRIEYIDESLPNSSICTVKD